MVFPIKSPFSYGFPMVFLWFSYGNGPVPPIFIARQESPTPWAPAAPPPATPEKSVCPEGCGLAGCEL